MDSHGEKLPQAKVKTERDKGYQPSSVQAPSGGLYGATGETERPSLEERMKKDKQRVATTKRRAAGGV